MVLCVMPWESKDGWGQGRGRGRGQGRGYGGGGGGGRGFGRRGGFGGISLNVPPPPPGGVRVVASVEGDAGLDSVVSMVAARAPFIAVVDIVSGRPVYVGVFPNPAAGSGGAGRIFAELVLGLSASLVIVPQLGPNALAMLGDLRVQIVPPGTRLSDVLRRLGLLS